MDAGGGEAEGVAQPARSGREGDVDLKSFDRLRHPTRARRQRMVLRKATADLAKSASAHSAGTDSMMRTGAFLGKRSMISSHRSVIRGPYGLTAHGVGQECADHREPVLAPHLGHGQVEGPQAQVDVREGRQRTERAHLFLWRRGGSVARQHRVVVARAQQLRHHGQGGRLDVGGDRRRSRRHG